MTIKILPYKAGSASCRELSRALGVRRIRLEGSRVRPRPNQVILNWGNTNPPPNLAGCNFLNRPDVIRNASNKKLFFEMVDNELTVPWTTSQEEAQRWVNDGSTVVVRNKLSGHSGEGIGLVGGHIEDGDHTGVVPSAPLYTKYVKKQDEYRVHVFRGQVIDVQKKMRKRDVPDNQVNWQVRNHANGFIYGRDGVQLSDRAANISVQCVRECSLDFGAVDIIFNRHDDRYSILEVNTAPGLTGTTLEKYVEAIRGIR